VSTSLILPYLALGAVLFRALLVGAKIIPSSCRRCGRPRERRRLGEQICGCAPAAAGSRSSDR
jgi:uncharacterized Zn finger protein (UPF0148 family)